MIDNRHRVLKEYKAEKQGYWSGSRIEGKKKQKTTNQQTNKQKKKQTDQHQGGNWELEGEHHKDSSKSFFSMSNNIIHLHVLPSRDKVVNSLSDAASKWLCLT